MPVETAADRAVFFSPDEFGVEAVYTPAATGVTSGPISGIFDAPTQRVEIEGLAVPDPMPSFFCRSADLPAAAKDGDAGDLLQVNGITYRVAEILHDGQGMTRLVLAKS